MKHVTSLQGFWVVSVVCATAILLVPVRSAHGQTQTPGQITQFDPSLNVVDSVITQDSSGNIGVGTTNPAVKLDVLGGDIRSDNGLLIGNNTDPGRTAVRGFSQIIHKPTETFGSTYYDVLAAFGFANFSTSQPSIAFNAFDSEARTDPGYTGDLAQLFGSNAAGFHQGSGQIRDVSGSLAQGFNGGSGTINRLIGGAVVYANEGSGSATNAYGLLVVRPSSVGSNNNITNAYGIYIEDQDRGTNRWQLYSEGTQPSYFAGNVGIGTPNPTAKLHVIGDFVVTGSKSALIETASYGKRQLYAVESPENWFEDFGSAKLTDGQAVIVLDPIFVETVNTDMTYHVFMTPNGDCLLSAVDKSETSFTVKQLFGQDHACAFDYRIVARRKGYEKVRLAKTEDVK
jgi:hypothetical protein